MSSITAETSAVLPLSGQSGAPKLVISERRIGDFDVDSVTSAPLKIDVKFAIKVPQEKAFELVLRDLGSWFKEIGDITWNHERTKGAPAMSGSNLRGSAHLARTACTKTSCSMIPRTPTPTASTRYVRR